MLKKLEIDNYKCFQNFELNFGDRRSLLLLGKNGSGKTAMLECLAILQTIARGEGSIPKLLPGDCMTVWTCKNTFHFALEAIIGANNYCFSLDLELPPGFHTYRVARESAHCGGKSIYERELATVTLSNAHSFGLDWHTIALPMIFESSASSPLLALKNWLAEMFLLRPIPDKIGDTGGDNVFLQMNGANFAPYLMTKLSEDYSLFVDIHKYARDFMPDFRSLKSTPNGRNGIELEVSFDNCPKDIPFRNLSDGEKIYILQAFILGMASRKKDMLVFWDEPDNFISRGEIQGFTRALRAAFMKQGQIVITSHSQAAASAFSPESTLTLERASHTASPFPVTVPEEVDFYSYIDSLDRGNLQNE